MVFNPTSDFMIDQGDGPMPAPVPVQRDLLRRRRDAPEGRITGWSNVPAAARSTTTSTDARKDPALPFGLALVPGKGDRGNRLLVADGLDRHRRRLRRHFQKVDDPSLFVDPKIAATGSAPYNVVFLKDRVYVAYAGDRIGGGAVSVFKANGSFKKRLVRTGRRHAAAPVGHGDRAQALGQVRRPAAGRQRLTTAGSTSSTGAAGTSRAP